MSYNSGIALKGIQLKQEHLRVFNINKYLLGK